MKELKFGDLIIILALLSLTAVLLVRLHITSGDRVSVSANGKMYEFSLLKTGEYTVEGAIGKTTILIHDGKVRIIDSPCTNKICVHQKDADTIICLPNKVIVKVNKTEGFDGISQ